MSWDMTSHDTASSQRWNTMMLAKFSGENCFFAELREKLWRHMKCHQTTLRSHNVPALIPANLSGLSGMLRTGRIRETRTTTNINKLNVLTEIKKSFFRVLLMCHITHMPTPLFQTLHIIPVAHLRDDILVQDHIASSRSFTWLR